MDLAALEEIRRVKYHYLRCVDLKLWDEIGEVFTGGARVDYGTKALGEPIRLTGRDEIVAFLRDSLGPAPLRAGRLRAHRRPGRRALPGVPCLTLRASTGPAETGRRC